MAEPLRPARLFPSSWHGTPLSRALALSKVSLNSEPFCIRVQLTGYIPEIAKAAGFPKPILQGLCTFGLTCKAVVDNVLDGDPTQITGYGVRFAGIFFPGETLITKVWKIDDKLLISSHSQERGDVVLSNAFMTVK